jgi:hypothetical protein
MICYFVTQYGDAANLPGMLFPLSEGRNRVCVGFAGHGECAIKLVNIDYTVAGNSLMKSKEHLLPGRKDTLFLSKKEELKRF